MVEPPTSAELDAIRRHLVTLPALEGARVDVDEELGVTFVRGPGSGTATSYAGLPRWDGGDWAADLVALRRRMFEDGLWPSLLLCDRLDVPPGLEAELHAQGWMRVTGETVRWVGHASVVPHLEPLLRVEAVRPRSADTHTTLERRIFGLGSDESARRREALTVALHEGRLRAWVVWLDDEPVAVARLSQGDDVAGLQGVGVVAERRGQGFGTLITTIATRAGLATGNRLVWLSVHEDNDVAVRLYTRLGFEPAFSWTRWLLTEDPQGR